MSAPLPVTDRVETPRAGFLKVWYAGPERDCAGDGCTRGIVPGGSAYIDIWSPEALHYCDNCGPVRRYERADDIRLGLYQPPATREERP